MTTPNTTDETPTPKDNMSKSAALRLEAYSSASYYKQGNSWVLSVYDPTIRMNRITESLTYRQVIHACCSHRRMTALGLMHPDRAKLALYEFGDSLTADEFDEVAAMTLAAVRERLRGYVSAI
jgi:hypothetical protein